MAAVSDSVAGLGGQGALSGTGRGSSGSTTRRLAGAARSSRGRLRPTSPSGPSLLRAAPAWRGSSLAGRERGRDAGTPAPASGHDGSECSLLDVYHSEASGSPTGRKLAQRRDLRLTDELELRVGRLQPQRRRVRAVFLGERIAGRLASTSDVRSPSWVSTIAAWNDSIGTLRTLPDLNRESQEQEQKKWRRTLTPQDGTERRVVASYSPRQNRDHRPRILRPKAIAGQLLPWRTLTVGDER